MAGETDLTYVLVASLLTETLETCPLKLERVSNSDTFIHLSTEEPNEYKQKVRGKKKSLRTRKTKVTIHRYEPRLYREIIKSNTRG